MSYLSVTIHIKTNEKRNKVNTMNTEQHIDINNLCSRKLWEILTLNLPAHHQQKNHIAQELITRSHYTNELESWRQQSH